MKKNLLSISIFTCLIAVVTAIADERIFGPDWEKQTFSNTKYVEYRRSVNITVTHSAMGNASNYRIPLENDELLISEIDNNLGFEIRAHGCGEFRVSKNLQGNPSSYRVRLGDIIHYDLDADGKIDARFDMKSNEPLIVLSGVETPVRNSKDGFKSTRKSSIDGLTTYIFEHGKWINIDQKK